MKAYDHIYLSPHYDDAALSCGGTIRRQCQQGHAVLVITIGAAAPDPEKPLSPFAKRIHAAMGEPADLVSARLREDKASMACLGADAVWLDFHDAVYRGEAEEGGWFYTRIAEIFGTIHPAEENRFEALTDAMRVHLKASTDAHIYAPLGVGGHVDHQHAHRAARALQTQGWSIAFYEDYPYVDPEYRLPFGEENTVTVASVLAKLQDLRVEARISRFSEADLLEKIESVRVYTSQVPMLFGDEATMAKRIRSYALHVGEEGPAERFWVPV